MDRIIYTYPTQSSAFMDKIMRVVSNETGYSEELICQKNRKREIVEARQLAMRLSKQFTNASLADIGRRIGMKDHATVLHACKTINNLRDSDRKFSARYDALFLMVGELVVDMKETTLVCKTCGKDSIHVREWVDINTRKFIDPEERHLSIDNWCVTCQSPTTIITRGEYIVLQNEIEAQENAEELINASHEEQKQQIIELEKELGV